MNQKKMYFKVCKSLMRRNKSLSVGLFIMSIFVILLGMLGLNITNCAKASISNYINSSNLPDKLYTTQVMKNSLSEEFLSFDGVKNVDTRFVVNCNFDVESDGIFSGNLITYNHSGFNKFTVVKETENISDSIKSYIPAGFANRHNINPGDSITLYVNKLKISTVVKAIVSSPESTYGDKDFMSNHEGYSYCNVYVDYFDIKDFLGISEICNQWLFYFDENITDTKKSELIEKINTKFGDNIIHLKDFEKSKNNFIGLKGNLESVNTLGHFFSILISLITLGFNFIFIQIIIKKEKQTIGLLKALGYKKKNIVNLFMIFTLLLNLPAIVISLPLSILFIRIALIGIEPNFNIPLNSISISPLVVLILVLGTLLIGFISSILCSSQIAKIDPSAAFGKSVDAMRKPVKFLSKIKGFKFAKISLTSIIRNIGRQIVGSLCISACILFMFISLEGYSANGKVRDGGYGERFSYDYVIRNIDESDYETIKNKIDGIEIIEPNAFAELETEFGSKRIAVINENSQLNILRNEENELLSPNGGAIIDQFTANNNNLAVGDFITINNKKIKITGIALEYIFAITYIGWDVAEEINLSSINGAMIQLKSEYSTKQFTKEIFDIDPDIYLVNRIDQEVYSYDKYTAMTFTFLALGILSFIIGGLLVGNTAFVDFLENRTKYSTLRALGCPMRNIISISLIENTSRSIFGCLISLPVSYFFACLLFSLLSSSHTYYAMSNFFLYFFISSAICVIYIIISVLITFIAIRKLDFVHQLNSRE